MRLKPQSRALTAAVAAASAASLLAAGVTAAHALTSPSAPVATVPASSGAVGPAPSAVPAPRDQVAEPGTMTTSVAASSALASASQRVCGDAGAKWLRVRVADLRLDGADRLTLTSDSGDSLALTARNWTGKGFYTRALKGSCVTVTEDLASTGSRYSIDQVQSSRASLEAATVTVAAAGDICGSACDQTRALLDGMNPSAVLTAGDNAYESGTLSEFNSSYDPEWGLYKSITYPTPGNHEYKTSGASGYFSYFGSRAGESGKGYYSYDVGDWHVVALNSNISRTATSTQVQWLQNDLAATTKPCIAAHWHHSRFAAGNYGDDSTVKPFWDALYAAHADLVITGHDHNYIRFAKSRPDGTADSAAGIRQLLIGTGGRALYGSGGTTNATIEKSNYNTFGVGRLTLTSTGYTADFVPVAGRTFTDTVTSSCNTKGSTPVPNFALSAAPSSMSVNPGASGTSTVTVSSTGGFNAATSLTASGLPAGVTASFSPASVTPAANGTATSTVTFTASTSAAAGTSAVTITGTSGGTARTTTVNLTVNATGGTVLTNGVAKTNLAGAQGSSTYYTLSVPTGATSLKFVTSGGTGDADLYVKAGSQPTTSAYDCKSDGSTTAETCTISSITPGTYHVLLRGYSAYSGVSLTGTYTTTTDPTPTLTSGVPVTGLAGASGSQLFYRLDVPSGATSVVVEISGGTGDADLYVKAGSKPTTSSYDCRPYLNGNAEKCTDTTVTPGPYYVLLQGYTAYSGLTLKGTFAP